MTMKDYLAPGVWVEDDDNTAFHIDVKVVADHLGIPFTPHTQAMIIEEAKKVFKESFPDANIKETME